MLLERAKAGEPWAIHELLDRLLGKPRVQIEFDANRGLVREYAEEKRFQEPFLRDFLKTLETTALVEKRFPDAFFWQQSRGWTITLYGYLVSENILNRLVERPRDAESQ